MNLAAALAAGALVGLAAGTLHFAGLHLVVRSFADGRAGLALLLQLARLALLAALLLPVAGLGTAALLSALGGILVARTFALRRSRLP